MTELDRRAFIRAGGISVALAAVFAACGGAKKSGAASGANTTTTSGPGAPRDVQILRTAASVEYVALAVCDKAISSGLAKTAAVSEAVTLFRGQHDLQAKFFVSATEKAGGTRFDQPNPVLLQKLQPAIDALKDETGVVQLLSTVEQVAAATYQSTVGTFKDASLNVGVMSVGAAAARHIAVLAGLIKQPQVPKAFFTTEAAVALVSPA